MSARPSTPAPAPLELFARLLNGQLAETAWSRFVRAYDAGIATREERTAYAAFLNDALHDLGPRRVALAKPEELTEILASTRT